MEKENVDFRDLFSLLEEKTKSNKNEIKDKSKINSEYFNLLSKKIKNIEVEQNAILSFNEEAFFNWQMSEENINEALNLKLKVGEQIRTLNDVLFVLLIMFSPLFTYNLLILSNPQGSIQTTTLVLILLCICVLLSTFLCSFLSYSKFFSKKIFNKNIIDNYRKLNKHCYIGEYIYQKNKKDNNIFNKILKKEILKNKKSKENSFDYTKNSIKKLEEEIMDIAQKNYDKYESLEEKKLNCFLQIEILNRF